MNIQELLTLIFDSGANSIQIHRNVVRHGNENNEGDYDVLKLKIGNTVLHANNDEAEWCLDK
ncbi:hypothetical protein [Methylomonas koyamae]|uniref:hypothetical protein n=1 Tax=Methylomonas koyamae TaxID=702114 RepID=UPI001C332CED|nr:hypothetical protein [Methylomonas koyamae]BBL56981.1 hypothetical protein MKFW12EY_05940 [Methylomonas koyamae]